MRACLLLAILVGCLLGSWLSPRAQEATTAVSTSSIQPPAPGYRRLSVKSKRQIFQIDTGTYRFMDDVQFDTEGLSLRADDVVYDEKAKVATAKGRLTLKLEDGSLYHGQTLELNVATRTWQFHDYDVAYPPGFFGKPLVGPLFLQGKSAAGTLNQATGDDTRVTSCDLPEPHFFLTAGEVEIFPGDKLIARDIDIVLLDHRVVHLPWFFIWLKQRRLPVVPEVGKNATEGRYLRTLYQYVFNAQNLGGIRVDLTEKLGTGIGLDHFYTVPQGYGEAFLYGREGQDEYVARVDHSQQLPYDFHLDVKGDVRKNSQFTSSPTTLTDVNMQLRRDSTHAHLNMNYVRRLNSGDYGADNANGYLHYDLNTNGGRFSYSGEYSSYRRTGLSEDAAANQELWNRIQWNRKVPFGTLNLRVDDRMDPDGDKYIGDNNVAGLQRLPEVYLEMNQNDLKWGLFKKMPSTLTVGWGRYDEQPNDVQLGRYRFEWETNPKPITWGSTSFTPTFGLRQSVYDDASQTAHYAYNNGLSVRSTFGAWSHVVNYTKRDGHGFTPFRFDTVYPNESVTDSLQYKTGKLETYLTGGRDLMNERWNDLTLRLVSRPSTRLEMNHNLGYDVNRGNWRDLVSRIGYQDARTRLRLNTRYDLEEARMEHVSTELNWVPSTRWRLQWLGGYDAVNQKLLYNEFLVTRDLHCWDVSAYYSYQSKDFYVYFRLKALDVPLPRFGVGRGGEVLTSGADFGY